MWSACGPLFPTVWRNDSNCWNYIAYSAYTCRYVRFFVMTDITVAEMHLKRKAGICRKGS